MRRFQQKELIVRAKKIAVHNCKLVILAGKPNVFVLFRNSMGTKDLCNVSMRKKVKAIHCCTLLNASYILAISGKNVAVGNFLFFSCTFGPFRAEMFQMAVSYSQMVHFGHFWQNRSGRAFFILSRHILAILGENAPLGCF